MGIGIAHGPSYVRMGVTPGKPLADTRAFIEKFRAETAFGPLPPIIVAALRKKMVALSGELAEGVVFANVVAVAHGPVAGGTARGQAQRSRLLHRQHDPDLHQRRRRGRPRGEPAHAHQLRLPAQLPELLAGGGLRRGDGRDRKGDRRGPPRRRAEVPHRQVAGRNHAVRAGRQGARRRRRLARGGRAHADPGAVLGGRQPDEGDRRSLRCVRADANS